MRPFVHTGAVLRAIPLDTAVARTPAADTAVARTPAADTAVASTLAADTAVALTPAAETTVLRAISVDAALLRRLRGPARRARIHSVFARVINIEVGDGSLLTLAHRDLDDAPDTVVTDLDVWTAFGIEPGTEAGLSAGAIDLGGLARVMLDLARRWRCRLPRIVRDERDERMLRANLPLARAHLELHGSGLGIGGAARQPASGLEATMAASFRVRVEALLRAIARNDEPGALAQVDRLLGLGTGLTPSGDDVLIGLLAALHTTGDARDGWRALGEHVTRRAGEATHLISAAALRHAASGRVRASIADLCRALVYETPGSAVQALEQVMRIGSGSGTEIAFGVLAGFRLHLQRDRRRGPPPAQRGVPRPHRGTSSGQRDTSLAQRDTSLAQRDTSLAQRGTPLAQRDTSPTQRGTSSTQRGASSTHQWTSPTQHRTAGIVHGR
ncbi:MAG: DUF2877 domain-containing protein [Burkholderiales bacterium]|nr:MAG: DUF2877 domain-containing protein [Burkholderiales bacterium]